MLDTGCWILDAGYGMLDTESIVILSHPASRTLHPASIQGAACVTSQGKAV